MPDLALSSLIAELRASDPDWSASIARFRAYRRAQARQYERRARLDEPPAWTLYKDWNPSAVQPTGPITQPARPSALPVHPATAAQIERGFTPWPKLKAKPVQTQAGQQTSAIPDDLLRGLHEFR